MDELEKVQAQIAELVRKAEELTAQKKPAIIEEMISKINAYGITAEELGLVTPNKKRIQRRKGNLIVTEPVSDSGRVPVAIKYQHENHTWSGRGRQPKWMVAYLEAGGTIEEITIQAE